MVSPLGSEWVEHLCFLQQVGAGGGVHLCMGGGREGPVELISTGTSGI